MAGSDLPVARIVKPIILLNDQIQRHATTGFLYDGRDETKIALDYLTQAGFVTSRTLKYLDNVESGEVDGPKLVVYDTDSPEMGLGLLAGDDIKKGETVGLLGGQVINEEAGDQIEGDRRSYLTRLTPQTQIDSRLSGNELRFLNHQCEGENMSFVVQRIRRRLAVVMEADADVVYGEVLSIRYAEPETPPNDRYTGILDCKCPAKKHLLGKYVQRQVFAGTYKRKRGKFAKEHRGQFKKRSNNYSNL